MRSIARIVRRSLSSLERRWVAARPGTVLIMVVVLLVLLALIGTAFVATARIDRESAGQNTANTQIDLLLRGAKSMAISTLVENLFGTAPGALVETYRPAGIVTISTANTPNPGYGHWTGYNTGGVGSLQFGNPNDFFLASRIPLLPTDVGGTGSSPVWTSISYPLIMNGPGGGTNSIYQFDDPTGKSPSVALTQPMTSSKNPGFQPTDMTVNGVDYPALTWTDANGSAHTMIAADTTGEGIANAGLYRIPMAPINGITYYMAFRIIDNNSALNLNTAYGPDGDISSNASAETFPTWFPSSVDLQDLLVRSPYDEMYATNANTLASSINAWRFSGLYSGNASSLSPVDDSPATRSDFKFLNWGDALWQNLGRRVDDPAYMPNSPLSVTSPRYQTFGYSDSIAMAYKGCLRPAAGLSIVEQCLPYSTGVNSNAQILPYLPSNVSGWFAQNYNYAANMAPANNESKGVSFNASNYPIRPLLTGRDLLSNAIQAHDMSATAGVGLQSVAPTIFTQGPDGGAVAMRPYIDPVEPAGASAPPPSYATPCRSSINTAMEVDLWRAFWNVMCDDTKSYQVPAYTLRNDASGLVPGYQGIFGNPIRDSNNTITGPLGSGDYITPYNQMLVRAAIAASNVCNLRDGNNYDFFYHNNGGPNGSDSKFQFKVCVPTHNYPNGADVEIFGVKAQPFITELYVNTNEGTGDANYGGTANSFGYIALELYNPYPFEINIGNCQIDFVLRTAATAGILAPQSYGSYAANPLSNLCVSNDSTGSATMTIQPYGFLVLENYSSAGGHAGYRPASSGLPKTGVIPVGNSTKYPRTNFVYSEYILNAYCGNGVSGSWSTGGAHGTTASGAGVGQEMILVRPRVATWAIDAATGLWELTYGSTTTGSAQAQVSESDLIALDQIDLTGFTMPTSATAGFRVLHYVRATPSSAPTAATPDPNAWMFVYPGHYDPSATAFPASLGFRQEGIEPPLASDTWSTGGKEPAIPTPVSLGQGSAVASAPSAATHLPIQLAAYGWGGRNRSAATTGNQFPFGGFARLGDMVEAPFIGAYTIRQPSPPNNNTTYYIEINSVTADAALADDLQDVGSPTAATIGQFQNIGRFCPCGNPTATGAALGDYQDPANPNTNTGAYRYQFAMRLFNYFTAEQNPYADWTPNVASDLDFDRDGGNGNSGSGTPVYPVGSGVSSSGYPGQPVPVPNGQNGVYTLLTANGRNATNTAQISNNSDAELDNYATEDADGSDGLININTASWKVLACLPLVPLTSGSGGANATDWVQTQKLAQAIVYFRDINDGTSSGHGHGPFKSLLELNMVPGFQYASGAISATVPSTEAMGDYYGDPNNSTASLGFPIATALRPVNDWETTMLAVNRLSNLVCLRSDSFTVYIQVQGWQNAGSPSLAQMVAQRRMAFIVDRSAVTGPPPNPTIPALPNKNVGIYMIPVN